MLLEVQSFLSVRVKLSIFTAVTRYCYILFFIILGLSPCMSQVSNPFSIIRSVADTLEQQALIAPVEESTTLDTENPFTVSHIPIRKNQYEEIERLGMSNRDVQENISLAYLPLWILIGSLCLLAYLLFNKKDHILVLLRSISNDNYMKMSNYEHASGRSVPYIVGYLLFLLNIALFIYLYLTKALDVHYNYLYLILLGCCVVFFIGKHFVNALSSNILNFTKEAKLYDFTAITLYNLMAVIILVLNILLVFGSSSWTKPIAALMSLVFIIALLSRYYKGVRIGQAHLNKYFVHFFLYFCAFEFTPWVIIYKVVKELL